MALNAYLQLEGETQGQIKGSVTQRGHEEKIAVHAATHQVISPRDAASGLPTGKRQHKPFVITKEVDKSSPLLYNALFNNENITDWELHFFTPSRAGREEHYYTVRLQNATIVDIRLTMPNNKYPDFMKLKEYEEVAFRYQNIEIVWEDGGITAVDDWEVPVV